MEISLSLNLSQLSGRHLIAYIKCWQCVVSSLARDTTIFKFNTYTIAVLVMFFLQMNYGLPAVSGIVVTSESKTTNAVQTKSTATNTNTNTKGLNDMLADFFYFYGGRYEINNHLISASIGRWQQITCQQKHFTPEQKR